MLRIKGRNGRATLYECGCTAEPDPHGTVYIVQCDIHEAAPAMYEKLKGSLEHAKKTREGIQRLSQRVLAGLPQCVHGIARAHCAVCRVGPV
jgi:hypothetical protein